MDALIKATLYLTQGPFPRGFLASDASRPAPARRARPASPALEGTRTAAAVVLLLAGVLLLAEAVVTLAWQEPFSAWQASRQQNELSVKLREAES
ncbi:MAG TPA: hypothetical protein VLA62_06125, partial [Solirubrobacterales bacterium]|nr:hypothetical protein [Solirubrobacterales bacterium]